MQEYFDQFSKNIRLTKAQSKDAKKKYTWVCRTLHKHYYPDRKYNWSTKYLFWSYKKKTNVRPLTTLQDVDTVFIMPKEEFEKYDKRENGQSDLLQKIREILKDTYATTEGVKARWKVVKIEFTDWTHNVEVLPSWENDNGTFTIPDSYNWWSWQTFDPRKEVENFEDSNLKTDWLTVKLARIIKTWKRFAKGCGIKSFEIDRFVVDFLEDYEYEGKYYGVLVLDFFQFIFPKVNPEDSSYVNTWIKRAKKALAYEEEWKYEHAVEKWRKVFGKCFPKSSNKNLINKTLNVPETEEFIEDRVASINIDPTYIVRLECHVSQDWWRETLLSKLKFINVKKKLRFTFNTNVPWPYNVMWKVRNYWAEAEKVKKLRWEISLDSWKNEKKEDSQYNGEHLIECYIIKNNVCVARGRLVVPIRRWLL